MNRLKTFFLSLDKQDCKYNKIYEGPMYDPVTNTTVYLPIYQDGEIGYRIERTSRKSLDVMGINILIPAEYFENDCKTEVVLYDFLARNFSEVVDKMNEDICADGGNHLVTGYFLFPDISKEVHERNVCYTYWFGERKYVNVQVHFQLPRGNHKRAAKILCKQFPQSVKKFLDDLDFGELREAEQLYKLQIQIRKWLKESTYCCFIANGSRLVESSEEEATLFLAPKEDEIEIYGIKGMGIRRGVTVLTGRGYSGKSTMLNAVSDGIYNFVKGSGKELVITDEDAVYIAAEDGRSVRGADISVFMKIPNMDEKDFSTDYASGSTSQAANVVEAVEAGAKLLLLDEDRSAANFLIRDSVMRELIPDESITPLVDIANPLYEKRNVSLIIVAGGSSEFLYRADTILFFDKYIVKNITEQFQAKFGTRETKTEVEFPTAFQKKKRFPDSSDRSFEEMLQVSSYEIVNMGGEIINASHLYNVSSQMQLNAIAFIVRKMYLFGDRIEKSGETFDEILDPVFCEIQKNGLDSIFVSKYNCERWMEMPRKIDVMAFLNRMKNVEFPTKIMV